MKRQGFRWGAGLALAAGVWAPAHAITFDIPLFGESLPATLNTMVTVGAAWRMESPASDLIGKANLNPDVCGGRFQSCQGLFTGQLHPSQQLTPGANPGALTMRIDDGNLNYDKHDLISGIGKITQDFNVTWDGFGIFARWLAFYDDVNYRLDERYTNRITPENRDQVGTTGNPESNRYFQRVFGPGGNFSAERSNDDVLEQVGAGFQLLDLNIYGDINLFENYPIRFKIGRQTLNWGESTLLAVNSLNSINPVNANNLYRIGFAVEEVFTPVGLALFSFEPFYNATAEVFYQYDWEPFEIPPPGSYFSFVDLGTPNINNFVNLSFGGSADDPASVGYFLDNPLALITPTSASVGRLPDREASNGGQFGVSFKYFAEDLNYGTEFGFYYSRLHSRLPFISFQSTDASCARAEGNPLQQNANSTLSFINTCQNVPGLTVAGARTQFLQDALPLVLNPANLGDLGIQNLPGGLNALLNLLGSLTTDIAPTPENKSQFDDAVPLDSGAIIFEYPEDIDTFGFSFNTTFGELALQGELAYRPNQPLQVAIMDLAFTGANPTLTRCHDPAVGCAGTSAGVGFNPDGSHGGAGGGANYGSSDAVENGNDGLGYNDTLNLFLGHVPGSARSFPSFIGPYRGYAQGEFPANSYIQGWEEFDVFQYNLGTTRVYGATENPFGADQVQLVSEFGFVHIPSLPGLDELQIEGPGIYTHASAGADGSGANGSQQACGANNPTCITGADGLRFNPTQAPLDAYVDKFSWGYRVIAIVRYESVFPGISFEPFFIWSHDVQGTSPGPAEIFVEDRKSVTLSVETRYKSALSMTLGYQWFTGAGSENLYRDRDFAQAVVQYLF